MKHLYLILFSIFFLAACHGQKLTYQDGSIEFEDEVVETINVILDPKPDLLENKFEKWVKQNYDVNLKDKQLLFFDKEFMSAKGVVIPAISSKKIDLIVKVDQTRNDLTTLHVFSRFGYNSWITQEEYPYEYSALENMVIQFIEEYLPEYYYEQLDEAKENLEDLKDEQTDMADDFDKNLEEIESLQTENAELMRKLKQNQARIVKAKSNVKMKRKDYKNIKSRVKKH